MFRLFPNETLHDMLKELILPIKTFVKDMHTELTIPIEALKSTHGAKKMLPNQMTLQFDVANSDIKQLHA